MAYRIIYETEKTNSQQGRGIRRLVLTTCFFLCFLWMVGFFWPEGETLMKQLIIPGDPDKTLEAVQVFAQEIGSGFPLTDAARNFYLTVWNHGYSD